MKLISWNVNGIRAIMKKDFSAFVRREKPDLLALQEIKISDDKKDLVNFDLSDYGEFWFPAQRPGYSGTLILFKKNIKVLSQKNGWDLEKFDREGRFQVLELPAFYFVNTYFPNSNDQLSRLPYKLEFNQELLKRLKKMNQKKPLVIGGDFNVAHQEIDLARPRANQGQAGFTEEERRWMSDFLQAGFIDTFRQKHPSRIKYSWWSFRAGARARNVGWRIDYLCLTKKMAERIIKADILDQVPGSDHAPISLILKN